jgi:superfamily II DNA or RNA helicase
MDCPPGKIKNPQTNRCAKIDGKLGKKIIKSKKIKKTKSKSKSKSKTKSKSKSKSKKDKLKSNNKMVCKYGKNPNTGVCYKSPCKYGRDLDTGKCNKTECKYGRDPITGKCRRGPEKKESVPIKEWTEPPVPIRRKKMKNMDCIENSKIPLKQVQIDTVKMFAKRESLLVVHGTGVGKTLTAITSSQCYLNQYPDNKVIVIAPASVQKNFHKEMIKYGGHITDNYSFYTYDKVMLLDKKKTPVDASNAMLILDEVHNIKNYTGKKFESVMECAIKCDKILLLTATPIINNIGDFISIINLLYKSYIIIPSQKMLRKYEENPKIEPPTIYKYRNEAKYELNMSFKRDLKERDQENYEKLNGIIKKLLTGRVSYVSKLNSLDFPSFEIHEEFIKMTSKYENKYKKAIDEIIEENKDVKNNEGLIKKQLKILKIDQPAYTKKDIKNAYKSRIIKYNENPDKLKKLQEAYEILNNELDNKEYIDSDEESEDINKLFKNPRSFYNGHRRAVNKAGEEYFSQKISRVIDKIKHTQSIIFSNWIEFGIEIIEKILIENNIKYGVFSGDTPEDIRNNIVKQYNNREIQVIVVTKAGTEGLDLKNTRNVVVLDPVWHPAGLEQIIGRAIRRDSHALLPLEERHVDVWLLLLVEKSYFTTGVSESGDLILHQIIKNKEDLVKQTNNMLESISVINTEE